MKTYAVAHSDDTFRLSLTKDEYSVTLLLEDKSNNSTPIQVSFLKYTNSTDKLSKALTYAVAAFNSAMDCELLPMTEEEQELTFEEISF